MAFLLPTLTLSRFEERLFRSSRIPLPPLAVERLHAHYQALVRWNARLGLIGPGTADEVVERHYGESLRALPLLPAGPGELVDLGSGAGFPGFVLAACRPDLHLTMVEARERKWAFLEAAARHAALPCRCLNVRVRVPLPSGLPETIHIVTSRALRLDRPLLSALASRMTGQGAFVLWTADRRPELPTELEAEGSTELGGGTAREILILRPRDRQGATGS